MDWTKESVHENPYVLIPIFILLGLGVELALSQRALCFLVGIIVLLAIYLGLSVVFREEGEAL